LVTVVAHAAAISAGEWITASGEWINDRAHGQQFKARFLKTSAPSSIDGIDKYLGSGMIRGIGPAYAKKMVKAFGEKVFDSSRPSQASDRPKAVPLAPPRLFGSGPCLPTARGARIPILLEGPRHPAVR
jgi:hypothetical protein